ncbi:hypothetical protein H4R20_001612 [Coemansia guatemalensis]|uniref:ABC1 atypical kinase-like domain-containing protein n=1 Tax=Coemansia guatemalensis TaxID=2761395 RepID=A0A9W8LUD6_9FUNG|nr:hypothetical protein H4R20_001612 [Coemansia guatemalensis]
MLRSCSRARTPLATTLRTQWRGYIDFKGRRGYSTLWKGWRQTAHGLKPRTVVLVGSLAAVAVGTGLRKQVEAEEHTYVSHNDDWTSEIDENESPKAPLSPVLERTFLQRLRDYGLAICRVFALDSAWEILLTVLRTGELLVYFVPLVATYPVVWFGARDPSRGNETAGTLWWYRFLRRQMSCAGPTFVKLAQWAASRNDLFSAQLCTELSRLHDSNRTHSARVSRAAIAQALGVASIDQAFEAFDDCPLGAGAVAQVHCGRLSADFIRSLLEDAQRVPGKRQMALDRLQANPAVAVKVLHPGVARQIERDLRIMTWGARMLSLLPGIRWLSLPEEVAVFGDMMRAQVDLRVEARNAERFSKNFSNRAGVTFPRAFLSLDSAQVLVESFCDGVPLRAFLDIDGHTPFDRELGARGLNAFLHMLIYDNFVHADLHPGNIMVVLSPPFVGSPLDRFVEDFYDMSPFNSKRRLLERQLPTSTEAHCHIRGILDEYEAGAISVTRKNEELHAYADLLYNSGFTASLCFLDCGLVTSLDSLNRRNFIDLFESVCTFDGDRAGHLMIDRCLTPELVVDPEIFVLRIQDIILNVRRVSLQLSKLTFSQVFVPVMRAVRLHHVRLAPDFINIIVAMFILEGIGRRLDPDSDVLRVALPMLRKCIKEDAQNEFSLPQQRTGERRRSSWSSWNLLKVWLYIEVREYIDRIRDWGYDDREFFGDFAPFLTADSNLA